MCYSCKQGRTLCYGDYSQGLTQMSKILSLCCFTAPSFPEKMSPIKALTMKDYENVSDQVARCFLNLNCDVVM